MIRILVLGATGVFGGRLARLLARDARFDLILAGRDKSKTELFAASLEGSARRCPAAFDIAAIRDALSEYAPQLVIHCAGPFQGQDYSVAKTAIDAGVHYVDLSDGRSFSEGFSVLDPAAKAAGVFALTACSTTSALTTATALRLGRDFGRIDSIRVGVTPGNRAPRGRAVVGAILSYVGEPIPVLRDGAEAYTTGWGSLSREILPGLGARWFSPCDAPDIAAMRVLFPSVRNIEFRAGLELAVLHLPLWMLAQLRRIRIMPNLAGATGIFHRAASWFEPLGTDAGGMFVELAGEGANGSFKRSRWSLWAGSGDGPFIPAMAAAAVAKALANGAAPAPGARLTMGDITLEEFEKEFSAYNINTAIEVSDDADDVSKAAWRAV